MKTFSSVNLFFCASLLLLGCTPLLGELPLPTELPGGPDDSFFGCNDYSIMLGVEANLATQCVTDSQCGQVIQGTGCGCMTDNLIANHNFDLSYLYELLDESEAAGCTMNLGTPCDCNGGVVPVCRAGRCVWE